MQNDLTSKKKIKSFFISRFPFFLKNDADQTKCFTTKYSLVQSRRLGE